MKSASKPKRSAKKRASKSKSESKVRMPEQPKECRLQDYDNDKADDGYDKHVNINKSEKECQEWHEDLREV